MLTNQNQRHLISRGMPVSPSTASSSESSSRRSFCAAPVDPTICGCKALPWIWSKGSKKENIQNEKAKNVLDFPHTFLEVQLFAGKSTKSHLNSRSCWSSSGFWSLAQIQTKPECSSKQWRLSSLCPLAKPPIVTGWAPQYSKKMSLAKDEEHPKPSKTIQFHCVHPTHKHLSSYATQRFQGSFQDSSVKGFQGSRVPGFQGSGSVPATGLGTNQCTTPRPRDWNPTVTAVQIFAEGFHDFL